MSDTNEGDAVDGVPLITYEYGVRYQLKSEGVERYAWGYIDGKQILRIAKTFNDSANYAYTIPVIKATVVIKSEWEDYNGQDD